MQKQISVKIYLAVKKTKEVTIMSAPGLACVGPKKVIRNSEAF